MTRKLTLTVEQARNLQAELRTKPQSEQTSWGSWAYVVETPVPEAPDSLLNPERLITGMKMAAMGCSDAQIAENLMWKYPGAALKALRKLLKP